MKAAIAAICLLLNYGLRLRADEALNLASAHEQKDSPSYVRVVQGRFADHPLPAKDVADAFGKNVSRLYAVYEVEFPPFKEAVLIDPKSMVVEMENVRKGEMTTLRLGNLGSEVAKFKNRPPLMQMLIRNTPPGIVRFFSNEGVTSRTNGWSASDIQLFAGLSKSQLYALQMQLLPNEFRTGNPLRRDDVPNNPWIKFTPAAGARVPVFVAREYLSRQNQDGKEEILEPKRIRISVRGACPFCWGSD